MWCKQLGAGLRVANHIRIIHDARLENQKPVPAAKSVAVSKERGTTVRTEAIGDALAAVGGLGNLLWCAFCHLDLLARHDDVVAVQTAGDVAAVGTVAESL